MSTLTNAPTDNALDNYYQKPFKEIVKELDVNIETGLTTERAIQSLEIYGPNELKKVKRSFFKVFLAPIINLLIIIYLISAVFMLVLGAASRTAPTFLILGANALVAIVQQFRAEKQMEALKKLSEATATVIRNGKEEVLSTNEIVKGDLIVLNQGDKVPADCRIVSSMNLSVDEASLTGESDPVKKNSTQDRLVQSELSLQEQKNMLFLGTYISAGQCKAIVVQIGSSTEIGKISVKLEESSTGDIPLRKKMNNIAIVLGIGVLALLISSIIFKSIYYSANGGLPADLTINQVLVNSIDLGMKVMPINLPVLTTIVLLTGVLAMAQKGVIVREISRTESLGRVSVVCSDKTGTLTKNEMTVIRIWTPDQEYSVSGYGYDPEGVIGKMGSEKISVKNQDLESLIISGLLNNNCILKEEKVKTLRKNIVRSNWSIIGLPTEAALKVLAKKYNPNIDIQLEKQSFIYEFNFDSAIKRMSKVFQNESSKTLYCKGATEWILPLCTQVQIEGKIVDLTSEMHTTILSNMNKYASEGYRILSITSRSLPSDTNLNSLEADDARERFEKDLVYLGFVVILDPPRDDVFQAIEECKSASITPIMITGDNISTAKAIGKQLGIYQEDINLAKEGKDVETLSDTDFPKTTVYGRVSPDHKQIIVSRYQSMDQIVSMSGDGVNDALALSMADCGLAMGIQGTEVAKEAADMIITDDSFSTIVTGIREGRGLFMKIRMIIYFFILVSVMEAIILFSSTLLFNDPEFQMWDYGQLNILYVTAHAFPSLGFTFSTISKDIMNEKPRNSAEIIGKKIFGLIFIQIILLGLGIVLAYYLTLNGKIGIDGINSIVGFNGSEIETDPSLAKIKARTMALVVLFITESLIMPLQIRRINHSIIDSLKDIKFIREFSFYLLSIVILVIMIYSQGIQELIGSNIGTTINCNFMFLTFKDWLICLGLCLPALLGFELIRYVARCKKIVF